MKTLVELLVVIAIGAIFLCNYMKTYKNIQEKIDGVETIDGIKYLIRNADVSYVMDRLAATRISKVIKNKTFERLNETEGRIKFGGVNYSLNLRGSENDLDIGATYQIKCEQVGNDVIMTIFGVGRDMKWYSPSVKQPGLVLNQVYHRWFKELLDVEVYKE